MLKIKISKKDLKNLYLGKNIASASETALSQDGDSVQDGDLILLRAMLDIVRDKSGRTLYPTVLIIWYRRLFKEVA